MIIQHNISSLNSIRQYGINNANLRSSIERLSSGYRINRAADDAAGLAISEKQRSQVRGLRRAIRNAEDGIGFVKTGDGAMDQISNMLQRMRELTIQALNEVYSDEDRAIIQAEFNELQSEIDRCNDQTEFNHINVFERYADTYYTFEGNRPWSQDQPHKITDENNTLTVRYQIKEDEPEKELSLSIPPGEYTTQELIDEMDDVVTALGDGADGLYLEYSEDGCCNMVLQDGEKIVDVTDGLSYLFYDQFRSTEVGALIGTTIFDPSCPLIVNNRNNELKFTIEYFDGNKKDMSIIIPDGNYTRNDIINKLNEELAGTGMTAGEYGEFSVQISGDDGFITGLKGNMFEIDDPKDGSMSSVFYDNTKYGNVTNTSAAFRGGAVLVDNSMDSSWKQFHIDDTNNTLRIKADGTDTWKEIRLSSGDYTINQMVTELQNQLDRAGLDIHVDKFRDGPLRTQNQNILYFYGLTLDSNLEGKNSIIEFDRSVASGAYDTLFVERKYTDHGDWASERYGSFSYTPPSLTGGRTFTSTDFPLTLTAPGNTIPLTISEKRATSDGQTVSDSSEYVLTLAEKDYTSLPELIEEINTQIANAGVGISGKIIARESGGRIQLVPEASNKTVVGIVLKDRSGAYDTLFVGKTVEYQYTPVSDRGPSPSITLDEISDPATFDSTNNSFQVNVDGTNRPVTIPPGTYTHDELEKIITDQLKGTTTTKPNTFSGSGTGRTTNYNKTYEGKGGTQTLANIQCSAKGSGGSTDGSTTSTGAKPATYTVPVSLGASTTVTDSNNSFSLLVNNTPYTITLDNGDFTPEQIAAQFQDKLNHSISSEANKVNVSLTGDKKLIFTTAMKGASNSLAFSSATSSFMNGISHKKTAAETTVSTKPLQSTIRIDSSCNTFSGTVDGNPYTVTLDDGAYSRQGFVDELNRQLINKGIKVHASLAGNYLHLKTTEANGTDSKIGFTTSSGGSAVQAMLGEMVTNTAPQAILSRPVESMVTMKPGENEFTVTLTKDGVPSPLSITIPPGDYSRDSLIAKMNELYNGKVTVSPNYYGSLTFTSADKGDGTAIKVDNSSAGSAGKAIFGTTTTKTPDITASFTPDGKLQLTGEGTGKSYSLSVAPKDGSGVLKPTEKIVTTGPSGKNGSANIGYYTLQSGPRSLSSSIQIDDHNKDFHFIYHTPSGQKTVNLSLDKKSYTQQELQTALQAKLDADPGAGQFKTEVSADKILITANNYGNNYYLSDLSGGFYEYVLKGTEERLTDMDTAYKPGEQVLSDAYIIGRQDVRNEPSIIHKDINDTLSLDLTIGDEVKTFQILLDPGTYSADQLTEQLQQKLNEQALALGLPENIVRVAVGKYTTTVIGANDANALQFYVDDSGETDLKPGKYKIDGLTGTALFEIFYKTTGELIPAYTTGTKDLGAGVTIEDGANELTFDVDGTPYKYTIPPGDYTQEELVDKLNELLEAPDDNGSKAPVSASLSGNSLKLTHDKIGKHEIVNVAGSARHEIFYGSSGRKDYESDLYLQIGANAGQGMTFRRYSMSTVSMGINSVTVSKWKNANKALVRIDDALDYLSGRRSKYGAVQNRLDVTIKGNGINEENQQAAESRLRDANMAKEMVDMAKSNILLQATMSMLSQANSSLQSVLPLLQH